MGRIDHVDIVVRGGIDLGRPLLFMVDWHDQWSCSNVRLVLDNLC